MPISDFDDFLSLKNDFVDFFSLCLDQLETFAKQLQYFQYVFLQLSTFYKSLMKKLENSSRSFLPQQLVTNN